MFEIGFPELIVIAIVTLLVVGPEKVPQAVKTVSFWIRRIRLSFENIKEEIEREIDADEIRAQIHNDSIMKSLNETQDKLQEAAIDLSRGVYESTAEQGTNSNESQGKKISDGKADA